MYQYTAWYQLSHQRRYRISRKYCVSQKIAIACFEARTQTFSYATYTCRCKRDVHMPSLEHNLNKLSLLASFYLLNWFVIYDNKSMAYHTAGNFRGRKFSQNGGLSRKFSSWKSSIVGVVTELSAFREIFSSKSLLWSHSLQFSPTKFSHLYSKSRACSLEHSMCDWPSAVNYCISFFNSRLFRETAFSGPTISIIRGCLGM